MPTYGLFALLTHVQRLVALMQEFMLPNGHTWVEVVVKGDPSRSERGIVYCKLCRHYDKSNTFGRGYRWVACMLGLPPAACDTLFSSLQEQP